MVRRVRRAGGRPPPLLEVLRPTVRGLRPFDRFGVHPHLLGPVRRHDPGRPEPERADESGTEPEPDPNHDPDSWGQSMNTAPPSDDADRPGMAANGRGRPRSAGARAAVAVSLASGATVAEAARAHGGPGADSPPLDAGRPVHVTGRPGPG